MIEFIASILTLSFILYCIFGGADFGGGILEVCTGRYRRKDQTHLITKAMGPVWEANHMWLIIAVVILFNGFPESYATLSIVYHVPLTVMLFGIVLRGCAFTFRHYDIHEDRSQRVYSLIFAASSTITPFVMGMMVASCLLGEVNGLDESYWNVYMAPWCNLFCCIAGCFTCAMFAYLAAVFLVEEAGNDRELAELFCRRAVGASIASLILGLLLAWIGWQRGVQLPEKPLFYYGFFGFLSLSTLLFFPILKSIIDDKRVSRTLVVIQTILVFSSYLFLMFPDFLRNSEAAGFGVIDIYQTAAGPSTLWYLAAALIAGLILVLPFLGYLLYIFKVQKGKVPE